MDVLVTNGPFTVPMLYNQVLKSKINVDFPDIKWTVQEIRFYQRTPIYIPLSQNGKSITLCRFVDPALAAPEQGKNIAEYNTRILMEGPFITMTFALEAQVEPSSQVLSKWLLSLLPLEIKRLTGVKLVGVFEHQSMFIVATMPLALWTLLPKRPAYNYVELVNSENLLLVSEKGGFSLTVSTPYPLQWTRRQLRRMLGISPLLDIQLMRSLHDGRYRWQPELGGTHCFGQEDLAMLLNIMSYEGNKLHDVMEVKPFSKLCTAMWYLRVVPDRISNRTPSGVVERNLVSNTFNVKETWIVKDALPYPAAVTDTGEDPIRCWNQQGRESQETSYRLANIAFVLGWKEVFAEGLKTVVWNWTGTGPVAMDPIACLEVPSSDPHESNGLPSTYCKAGVGSKA